jgi:hypothetical protein
MGKICPQLLSGFGNAGARLQFNQVSLTSLNLLSDFVQFVGRMIHGARLEHLN